MGTYTRGKVWSDGESLTAVDLNAEFDRIQALVNGGLGLENFASGEVELAGVINAGAPRFDTGGLENAERIANAVSEAVAADIKVVWVPRSMFGYIEDASYSTTIFDTGVLMVREGQVLPGHDVVAYGAKADDAAVDDTDAFTAAHDSAAAAAVGANPGAPVIIVSLPGEYQLDSGPTTSTGVGTIVFAGVTFAGAGTAPDHSFSGIWSAKQTGTDDLGNVAGTTTVSDSFNPGFDPAQWALVYAEVLVDEDAGTDETLFIGGPSQNPMVNDTGNLRFNFKRWKEAAAGGFFVLEYDLENQDSSAHDVIVTITAYFIRKV